MDSVRFKAVIWDLGGVILRTEDKIPRGALAEQHGMTYEGIDAAVFKSDSAELAFAGEIELASHWIAVRERFCLDDEGLRQFQRQFWAGDFIDQTLLDFICSLRARCKTALLSNAWSDTRTKLEARGVQACFDEVVISAEVGLVKPDPRIYQYSIQQLGVEAGEAIFVDDFIENIQAARALGMTGVHFQGPEQTISDVSRLLNAHE